MRSVITFCKSLGECLPALVLLGTFYVSSHFGDKAAAMGNAPLGVYGVGVVIGMIMAISFRATLLQAGASYKARKRGAESNAVDQQA